MGNAFDCQRQYVNPLENVEYQFYNYKILLNVKVLLYRLVTRTKDLCLHVSI